jgi:hypothetical protein
MSGFLTVFAKFIITIGYVAVLFISTSVASVSGNRASRKIPLAGLYTSCGRQAGNFSV